MSIVFYFSPMSSASPVASALAELGIPHERITLDLAAGDQRKPEFLKLNPNGKVPTMVVDDTPMFEALAIMTWLGETHGVEKRLWPQRGTPAHLEAVSWSTWAYVTYGATVVRLQFATNERLGSEYRNEAQAALARKDLQELLSVLNGRLEGRQYLMGENFSLVDVIVSGVVGYSLFFGTPLEAQPRVKAWLAACQARPSYGVGMNG